MEGWGNWGSANFFCQLFFSCGKMMWSRRKFILCFVLRMKSLSFFSRTKNEVWVREKKLKDFIRRTKQSMNFLRDHIILPKEKNNWQKKFALPKLSHPSMISRRIKNPSHFASWNLFSERTIAQFPRKVPHSKLCYPTELIFLPFC